MEKVKFELMTEYFPADVDKLKALVESGDRDEISKKAHIFGLDLSLIF